MEAEMNWKFIVAGAVVGGFLTVLGDLLLQVFLQGYAPKDPSVEFLVEPFVYCLGSVFSLVGAFTLTAIVKIVKARNKNTEGPTENVGIGPALLGGFLVAIALTIFTVVNSYYWSSKGYH
jgi:H+/Cl- antiporter ClcA